MLIADEKSWGRASEGRSPSWRVSCGALVIVIVCVCARRLMGEVRWGLEQCTLIKKP